MQIDARLWVLFVVGTVEDDGKVKKRTWIPREVNVADEEGCRYRG